MAIYHLSAKVISRASGRSAVAAAAYRSGERLLNERDGRAHDFRARSGVETTFIAAPDVAPSCMLDRQTLWSAVELHEKRSNSTTAREWEAALPAELDGSQREALSRQFAAAMVERFGIVADCALHTPSDEGDSRNHHLHMLTTTRAVTAEGFGAKTRELDGGKGRSGAVDEVRGLWADLCNQALETAQVNARVDHRSHDTIRADAQETAQAQEKATRSLIPLGKRQRVQEATQRATEARERAQGLPERPSVHKGPQRTAQERREARDRAAQDREALQRASEREPLSAGFVSERVFGDAVKALREIQQVGVRAFVRERLSAATEAAGRFMDRLLGLELVERDPTALAGDRLAADTNGWQVAAAVRDRPEAAAEVAWAATAAHHDRIRPVAVQSHWADALDAEIREFAKGIEQDLTVEELNELRGGEALGAFKEFEAEEQEKLDWGRAYLEAELAAGYDRKDAIEAVEGDRKIIAIQERSEQIKSAEAASRGRRSHERDDGIDL